MFQKIVVFNIANYIIIYFSIKNGDIPIFYIFLSICFIHLDSFSVEEITIRSFGV